jgi:hypothetical protein
MAPANILLVLAMIALVALVARHAFTRSMTSDQIVMAILAAGLLIAGGSVHAFNYFRSGADRSDPQSPPEAQGTPSYVKPSDMEMLSMIHRSSVEIFAGRPGFGHERMPVLPLEEEYFKPPMRILASTALQDHVNQAKSVSQPHPSVQNLIASGRFNPMQLGPWGLKMQRFQLVGLVQNPAPRVYVTDKLPEMKDAKSASTRDLDEFEGRALGSLRNGESLHVEERNGTIRMMGPIFAGQRCLECHQQRGQMLGAFTYVIERDPNFDPNFPQP